MRAHTRLFCPCIERSAAGHAELGLAGCLSTAGSASSQQTCPAFHTKSGAGRVLRSAGGTNLLDYWRDHGRISFSTTRQGVRSRASMTRTYGIFASSFTSRTRSGSEASKRHIERSSPRHKGRTNIPNRLSTRREIGRCVDRTPLSGCKLLHGDALQVTFYHVYGHVHLPVDHRTVRLTYFSTAARRRREVTRGAVGAF